MKLVAGLSFLMQATLCSMIVSLPIDLSSEPELQKLEGKGVRGRYVSVETVQELENGNCEWR